MRKSDNTAWEKQVVAPQKVIAMIEIAHPDDRRRLVEQAKAQKMLYFDQIFIEESAHLYPSELNSEHTFKGGFKVRFRAIKPSDEEEMRRLFYRFSDQSVYYNRLEIPFSLEDSS